MGECNEVDLKGIPSYKRIILNGKADELAKERKNNKTGTQDGAQVVL